MQERIADLRKQATKRYEQTQNPRLKYGLTISLNTRGLTLPTNPQNKQEVQTTADNCVVKPLFAQEHPEHEHLYTAATAEHTRFDDYNQAFAQTGLLITTKPGAQATLHLDRTFQSDVVEHILVVAAPNSTLRIIDSQTAGENLHSATVEIIAQESAKVDYATLQSLSTDYDLVSYRGHAHKDASINYFVANLGAGFQRATQDTSLVGEGASTKSYGVFLGAAKEQFDLAATAYHKADHTSSDMHTKGVLEGSSKAVYRGTIDIAADAFGCDGYQKEHTILLSENAVADAIPNLEIRNNDVRCSHGATIGRVDDEQLFYLTSRGITHREAVKMLVKGFFEPLTKLLDWPQLYERILPIVEEKIQ